MWLCNCVCTRIRSHIHRHKAHIHTWSHTHGHTHTHGYTHGNTNQRHTQRRCRLQLGCFPQAALQTRCCCMRQGCGRQRRSIHHPCRSPQSCRSHRPVGSCNSQWSLCSLLSLAASPPAQPKQPVPATAATQQPKQTLAPFLLARRDHHPHNQLVSFFG